MKELFTRILTYTLFGLLFYIFYNLFGFELAVIIALGQIMGEIILTNKNN